MLSLGRSGKCFSAGGDRSHPVAKGYGENDVLARYECAAIERKPVKKHDAGLLFVVKWKRMEESNMCPGRIGTDEFSSPR